MIHVLLSVCLLVAEGTESQPVGSYYRELGIQLDTKDFESATNDDHLYEIRPTLDGGIPFSPSSNCRIAAGWIIGGVFFRELLSHAKNRALRGRGKNEKLQPQEWKLKVV